MPGGKNVTKTTVNIVKDGERAGDEN